MRALLAAVQLGAALRAVAAELGIVGKRRGAVETPGRGHVLNQAWEPGPGHVHGRARPLRLGALVEGTNIAFGVHVPRLFVLAIAIHGERMLRQSWDKKNVLIKPVKPNPERPHRPPREQSERHGGRSTGIHLRDSGRAPKALGNMSGWLPANASNPYVARFGAVCTFQIVLGGVDSTKRRHPAPRFTLPDSISASWYRAG